MVSLKLLQEIEDYVDNEFGSWNYFGIRNYVKSAMDNDVNIKYPNSPYSAKQIIEWAEWNEKDSFLFTPGGQAIKGEKTSDFLFGTPDINPITEKKNSTADKNGIFVEFAKSRATDLLKVGLALGVVVILLEFAKAKAKKLGGT